MNNSHWRYSPLHLMLVLSLAYSAYAQVVEPSPFTPGERARTDISKIFDAAIVGRVSATFVDPIAACVRRYDGQFLNGGTVNCRTFQMGSPANEQGRNSDETQHLVRLTGNFNIQATGITQLQWLMVMKGTDKAVPSYFRTNCDANNQARYRIENQNGVVETVTICKNHPVEQVSYNDIVGTNGFLARLNASQTQYTYRLPTEAEWEYSARGGVLNADGTYPRYFFGEDERDLDLFSFYNENSHYSTHAVASKLANGYDLFDIHGNVWQWVSDLYDSNYGLSSSQLTARTDNPKGRAVGSTRVVRGGSWNDSARLFRSSNRSYSAPDDRLNVVGFRLVRTPR